MVQEIIKKIEEKKELLEEKRKEIPHVKAKIEREKLTEKEVQKLKKIVLKLEKDYEKIFKKESKIERERNKLKKENKTLTVKNKEYQKEVKVMKNRYKKLEKGKSYEEKEKEQLKQELEQVKSELKKYKDEEKRQKERNEHIPTLKAEIRELMTSKDAYVSKLEKQLKNERRKSQNYKKSLKGQSRSVTRKHNETINLEDEKRRIYQKLKVQEEVNKGLRKELNEKKEIELINRQEIYKSKSTENLLAELDARLNRETIHEYSTLPDLENKYKSVLGQERKKEEYSHDVYGYISKYNGKEYVINVENEEELELSKKYYLTEGTVVKVNVYKTGEVLLERMYLETASIPFNERTSVSNARSSKTRNSVTETYTGDLDGKQVLLLSGKQLLKYRKYFKEQIEIISPFEKNLNDVFRRIDKADIVLVRPDAVSHAVTDYLKEHKKERTVFLTATNVKDVGSKLNKKLYELKE